MRKAWLAAIGIALASAAGPGGAQTLAVPAAPDAPARTALPVRGTSMADVEARYGAPAERVAPVGQPPISRWVYPAFVVYFEYSHVVHAVALAGPAGTR